MAAPTGLVRSRPPRWLTRLLNGLIIFVAVSIVLAGLGYIYVRWQLGKINRVDIPGLAEDQAGRVMNVLLVGSDSRERVEGYLAEATGKDDPSAAGQRSDTIMVLHIDPRQGRAAIVSIPRDLWVPIAGEGYEDRINTAFSVGGAPTLIRTIQESLGIEINHYVEVDFAGFERIVDTVGGVKIYVDAPARDTNTGLDIPQAGCVQLDGYQSLAYVRSRYYESYEAGRWVPDEASDLGRIGRQQDFIRRMMKKAVSSGVRNPVTLNRLINIGVDNVTLDAGMSTRDIVAVARRFQSLDPDTVDMRTLPTAHATIGGASVLLLDEEEAQDELDLLAGRLQAGAAVRPAEVQVRVLNGNGGDGSAAKVAFALQQVGFSVTGRGDADSFSYRRSVIRYGPGKLDRAELLQSYLSAGAELEEDRTLGAADLALIVGTDYIGVRPGPAAPGGGTATTQPPPQSAPDPKGAPSQPAC